MSTFDRLADLPLEVEGYGLEGLQANVSSGFERLSTVVHLQGAGEEGIGEDVVYDAEDQVALQQAGPILDLKGTYALAEFCELIDGLDLFPVEPKRAGRSTALPWTWPCGRRASPSTQPWGGKSNRSRSWSRSGSGNRQARRRWTAGWPTTPACGSNSMPPAPGHRS
jgi:hypothetical protein